MFLVTSQGDGLYGLRRTRHADDIASSVGRRGLKAVRSRDVRIFKRWCTVYACIGRISGEDYSMEMAKDLWLTRRSKWEMICGLDNRTGMDS